MYSRYTPGRIVLAATKNKQRNERTKPSIVMNDTTTAAGAPVAPPRGPHVNHQHHHHNAGIPTNEDFELLALKLEEEQATQEAGTNNSATAKNNKATPPPKANKNSSVPTSAKLVFDSSTTTAPPATTSRPGASGGGVPLHQPQHKPHQTTPRKDTQHRNVYSNATFMDMVNNNDQYSYHQNNTLGDSFTRVLPSTSSSISRPNTQLHPQHDGPVRPVTVSLLHKCPAAAAAAVQVSSGASKEGSTQNRISTDRVSTSASTTTTTSTIPRRGPRLQDMAKILRRDDNTVQINWEQIERVKYMHERFSQGCLFSFNYNVLLVVASILAALGLVSNSSATIIASMLVSPIMGPVVGAAYAATIKDWSLCKRALKTEFISLIVCIAIGAAVGASTGWTALAKEWPTPEIVTRGSWTNFLVGLPIAFFSGLGVAVSLLDDQTSSLVGVAISASLLPPAVNSGILWIAYWFQEQDWLGGGDPTPMPAAQDLDKDFPDDDEYEPTLKDFRRSGIISLTLTLANIALIIISSMIMFRCKERLPVEKNIFWYDLGVARKIYRNLAFVSSEEHSPEEVISEENQAATLAEDHDEKKKENDLEAQEAAPSSSSSSRMDDGDVPFV